MNRYKKYLALIGHYVGLRSCRSGGAVVTSSYNLWGYGTDSRFAYEKYEDTGNPSDLPVTLHVDTLNPDVVNTDSTHGSLAWCMQQNFPRIIVFDISGVIDFTGQAARDGRTGYSETSICNYGS